MRVSAIEVIEQDDFCQLQAWVESGHDAELATTFAPFRLWYRFPAWCRPMLSAENGDPFLAALLFGAMLKHEPLVIDAPISPRLREALPLIQDIEMAFEPASQRVEVVAETRDHSLPDPGTVPGVGLFFSLGVDSWYSLVKNLRDHPSGPDAITHLIPLHGLDAPFQPWDETFPPEMLRNCQRIATETGKTLLPVVSNIRRVSGPLGSWPTMHGGGLIAVALALGAGLRRVHIAASTTYNRLYPWGSHPLLDPLWSTESLGVIHDGCELNTIDKTRVIAESHPDLVLQTLRPCAGFSPDYNCGACIKCLRTMLDLLIWGYLDACETLPHTFDLAHLRLALRPGGPVHVADYTRRLQALADQGLVPEVQQVLREHLALGMDQKWTPKRG